MIESIGQRLRLVFAPSHAVATPEELPPLPGQVVEFVGHGEDCLLSGRLRISTDRLTDMLNEHEEYQLVDVLIERLDDGRAVEIREVHVTRDELLLVHATGPRGNQDRRRRTRPHPVAMQLGPYHVRGYAHTLPGTDPVAAIRRRQPMVPLTEAWVEYVSGGVMQRHRFGTVLVNREQMDWIAPVLDEQVELPDLPVVFEKGPLLKDFTGALFDNPAS
jgi:hypothetical protein